MSALPEYQPFQKLSRLSRTMTVTEKIDGTNAQVLVTPEGQVHAGSRTRWITPEDDNAGFARWVKEHEEELRQLGPGLHAGEWYGQGIQRRYGLTVKRFALFNADKWGESGQRPLCCDVVPTLYRGPFSTEVVDVVLRSLESNGSAAVPGFMQPEGVVVYHHASRTLFKKTLGGDGHKGA